MTDWYRLVNIDWLAYTDWLDDMMCQPYSVRRKTPLEDQVNKNSNFADFVRFRPHTYARTELSLPPFMGVSYHKLAIQYHHICTTKMLKYVFCIKDTLKAFDDFKNKQKSLWINNFWYVKVYIIWKNMLKKNMLKKYPSEKINVTKDVLFFSLASTNSSQFCF